jgi:hypothetical protein
MRSFDSFPALEVHCLDEQSQYQRKQEPATNNGITGLEISGMKGNSTVDGARNLQRDIIIITERCNQLS